MEYKGADAEITTATSTLQQSCGSKLQETLVNTSYESRIEANEKAAECSPWAPDRSHWSADKDDILMAIKRKLDDKQVSHITLKNGTYPIRAGYVI